MIAITLTDVSGHMLLRYVELMFALEHVMERPLRDEPKGWRKLQTMAQKERNPEKLAAILERMNRLLTAHEKKSLRQQQVKPE